MRHFIQNHILPIDRKSIKKLLFNRGLLTMVTISILRGWEAFTCAARLRTTHRILV